MQLYNNTPTALFYSISSPGSGDCGTIIPGETVPWPGYDNTANVSVSFSGTVQSPTPPFAITSASTGVGKAVTIGIYDE